MASRKRKKAELERDLALVATCDAAGLTQAQTLEAVNADRAQRGLVEISRSQVSYDTAKARRMFGVLADEEVREATGRRLAQIEWLIREASQGYLRSLGDAVKSTTKTTARVGADGKPSTRDVRRGEERITQAGDPKFLLAMLKAIELAADLQQLRERTAQVEEKHPQYDRTRPEDPHAAQALLDQMTGTRHGKDGKVLLYRGKRRKRA